MHKGSRIKLRNCITPKQETINAIKVLQEVMTILEKHDYDKTCMDSKRKRDKHMIGIIKKTTIKLKLSLKTELLITKQNQSDQQLKKIFAHNHSSRYHMI